MIIERPLWLRSIIHVNMITRIVPNNGYIGGSLTFHSFAPNESASNVLNSKKASFKTKWKFSGFHSLLQSHQSNMSRIYFITFFRNTNCFVRFTRSYWYIIISSFCSNNSNVNLCRSQWLEKLSPLNCFLAEKSIYVLFSIWCLKIS